MSFTQSIPSLIRQRISIRKYQNVSLSTEVITDLQSQCQNQQNPFDADVTLQIASSSTAKLGTYGMIKSAQAFITATAVRSPSAYFALGFEAEALVLYATSLGLGSCILGGTYNKKQFQNSLSIPEDCLFPLVVSLGYPADQDSLLSRISRKAVKSATRKPVESLFFADNFQTSLAQVSSSLRDCLEMVRLAPSSQNSQPWRLLVTDRAIHFYAVDEKPMHQIDLGIAAYHFDAAARYYDLAYSLVLLEPPLKSTPFVYCFSFIEE